MRIEICKQTGLKICDITKLISVREDGFIRKSIQKNGETFYTEWNCGYIDAKGYSSIHDVETKKTVKIHRLVALAFIKNNDKNKSLVDHINGNRSDNRVENLRWVNSRGNAENKIRHRNGHLVGASYNEKRGKWLSSIVINRKHIHLGTFNSEVDAHKMYLKAIKELL